MHDLPPHGPRSFLFLVATQFTTVLNDNVFKQTVLLLAVATAGAGQPDDQPVAGLLFSLPFLLFAVVGGDLADRFSKRSMVIAAKVADAAIMAAAAAAFALREPALVAVVLFLTGTESAFLGPAKYGIVPELVPPRRLAWANGVLQGSVLLGIVAGTAAAGFAVETLERAFWAIPAALSGVALAGTFLALGIERVPAADPGRAIRMSPVQPLADGLRLAARTPHLLRAMGGVAAFNLAGAMALFAWNRLGPALGVARGLWSAGLGGLGLALGLGCLFAGRLSRRRLRTDLIPWGGAAFAAALAGVALGPRDPAWIFGVLAAGNFCAGLYLIPLQTLIQWLPDEAEKGRAQGTSQMLTWTFINAASLLTLAMDAAEVSPQGILLALGFVVVAASLALRPLSGFQPAAAVPGLSGPAP